MKPFFALVLWYQLSCTPKTLLSAANQTIFGGVTDYNYELHNDAIRTAFNYELTIFNYEHYGFTHTLILIINWLFITTMDSQTILIIEINYSTYKLYELTNLCVDTFSMCLSQVHNEQG